MKTLSVALLMLYTLVFSSVGIAGQTLSQSKEAVNIFFIQRADKATLMADKSKPSEYQLILKGVRDYIEYFSDRPVRLSGLYPTQDFISRWTDDKMRGSFNKMPPNAALSAVQPHLLKNKMINVMLQLSNPIYDAKTETLSYKVNILPGVKTELPLNHLKNVVLFIDSYCVSCVSSGF